MSKKPFYKCWWFWLIIGIAFLLCVGNITLAHFIKDSGANIFTAVSGWVSGIATAILGVIAVVQNRNYKEENDKLISYQQQRDWLIEQKNLINANLQNFLNIYNDIKENKYSKLISARTISLQNGTINFENISHDETLKGIEDLITYSAVNSYYYFDGVEELLDKVRKYTFKLRIFLKQIVDIIKKNEHKQFNEIVDLYKEINTLFNKYIYQVQTFTSKILAEDNPADIKAKLISKRDKQLEWIGRMEKAFKEMIEKWKN